MWRGSGGRAESDGNHQLLACSCSEETSAQSGVVPTRNIPHTHRHPAVTTNPPCGCLRSLQRRFGLLPRPPGARAVQTPPVGAGERVRGAEGRAYTVGRGLGASTGGGGRRRAGSGRGAGRGRPGRGSRARPRRGRGPGPFALTPGQPCPNAAHTLRRPPPPHCAPRHPPVVPPRGYRPSASTPTLGSRTGMSPPSSRGPSSTSPAAQARPGGRDRAGGGGRGGRRGLAGVHTPGCFGVGAQAGQQGWLAEMGAGVCASGRRVHPTGLRHPPFNPKHTGCFGPGEQAAHQSWLAEMGAWLRTIDPLHLISASTEGFFTRNDTTLLHLYNPGGLDWTAAGARRTAAGARRTAAGARRTGSQRAGAELLLARRAAAPRLARGCGTAHVPPAP